MIDIDSGEQPSRALPVTRTARRLADGRQIVYFDTDAEVAGDHARHSDQRDLPDVSTSSQMRFDPVRREWVIMASHRQTRTFLPPTDECPLCPSTPHRHTEIPSPRYAVAVFENRFPSLSGRATLHGDAPGGEPGPGELTAVAPGRGRCEVVCFTSDHTASFADLTPAHARLVIEAWADRTAELSEQPDVEQVFCFENRGAEIGVTLQHPHGQIYAYPFLTPVTTQMLTSARQYRARTGGNLFADVLAEEQAGPRVILRTAHWTAFVPAAARWPVEVHLYPNRQVPDLPALTDVERNELAHVYLDLLGRLDRLYGSSLPYIAAWHQAPVRGVDRDLAHLHLELFSIRRSADKLKYLAGSESAMGAFITDVLPEDVAERLRGVG